LKKVVGFFRIHRRADCGAWFWFAILCPPLLGDRLF
jgi:hypothetical protein